MGRGGRSHSGASVSRSTRSSNGHRSSSAGRPRSVSRLTGVSGTRIAAWSTRSTKSHKRQKSKRSRSTFSTKGKRSAKGTNQLKTTNKSSVSNGSSASRAISYNKCAKNNRSVKSNTSAKSNRSAKSDRSVNSQKSAKINRSARSFSTAKLTQSKGISAEEQSRIWAASRLSRISRSLASRVRRSSRSAPSVNVHPTDKINRVSKSSLERSRKSNRSVKFEKSTKKSPSTRTARCAAAGIRSNSNRSVSNKRERSSSASIQQRSHSFDATSNPKTAISPSIDQSRGRTSVRNRDLYQRRRRSSSVDATTPIPITQTPNLTEQDQKFDNLKRTPSDARREWNKRFPEGHIVIYTDGSAKGASSGMGIYMGPGHPLNRSQSVDGPPHTSDRAELLAAIQSLRNLRDWDQYRNEKVILRTDSWGVVKAAAGEKGGPHWYMNMIQSYPTEIAELREEAGRFPQGVVFEHVYAHDGDPGNEAADDLSRQVTVGPSRSRSMSRDRSGEPARRRSLSNDPTHIRTHSSYVPPDNQQ